MAKKSPERRPRGAIRRRGRSLQVIVYAGLDPLTGKKLYLRESTTDEAEARRILRRPPAAAAGGVLPGPGDPGRRAGDPDAG